ncbi:ABC transporter permease [Roseinatronobacter sp.]
MTSYNFESMAFFMPELGILAIAMMIAMLTGGIDLSIVGVANLAGITAGTVFGYLAGDAGAGTLGTGAVIFGVGIGLLVGVLAGLVNGLLISGLKITPILATLGTGQVFIGLCLVLTGGPAIVGFPPAWTWLGNGKIAAIPVPFVLFVVLCVVLSLLLARTSFGLRLKLIGTNPKAAVYAGIDKGRMIVFSYMLTGGLAAMAGILLSARTNAAKSDYGSSYLLQAVLIAVLGGTNPAGGKGNVWGVALAVISLTLLASGLQMMRVSNHLINFVWGAFLIAVIALNSLRSRKGR